MKPVTMLAGVALVGLLAGSVFAQPGGGGGRGNRGGFGGMGGMFAAPPAYDKLVSGDIGFNDGDPVTSAVIAKYLKKNLAEDASEQQTKNVPLTAAMTFVRVVFAAGGDPTTATSATKEDWAKGIAAMPARGGKKKKKEADNT
jgi:hypothetical protein